MSSKIREFDAMPKEAKQGAAVLVGAALASVAAGEVIIGRANPKLGFKVAMVGQGVLLAMFARAAQTKLDAARQGEDILDAANYVLHILERENVELTEFDASALHILFTDPKKGPSGNE